MSAGDEPVRIASTSCTAIARTWCRSMREFGGLAAARLHRRARRAGTDARAAARLRQPPHRQGPDHRARDSRCLQRGDEQGAQSRGAPVPRGPARSRRRERASDEGGSALQGAVAGPRARSPRAWRRAGQGPGAGTDAATFGRDAWPADAAGDSRRRSRGGTFPNRWAPRARAGSNHGGSARGTLRRQRGRRSQAARTSLRFRARRVRPHDCRWGSSATRSSSRWTTRGCASSISTSRTSACCSSGSCRG